MRSICHLHKLSRLLLDGFVHYAKISNKGQRVGDEEVALALLSCFHFLPSKHVNEGQWMRSRKIAGRFLPVGGRSIEKKDKGAEQSRWRGPLLSPCHVTATPSFSIMADFFTQLVCPDVAAIHADYQSGWLNALKSAGSWPFMRENLVFSLITQTRANVQQRLFELVDF